VALIKGGKYLNGGFVIRFLDVWIWSGFIESKLFAAARESTGSTYFLSFGKGRTVFYSGWCIRCIPLGN